MTTAIDDLLTRAGLPVTDLRPDLEHAPGPLAFATVSGAHLYGFPSRDSDVDLRGVHVLPAEDLLGLHEPEETRTRMWERDGVELDLVTHDLRKFVRLMLRPNGYVLEQLLSPLVVHTGPLHTELTALSPGVLTRNHAHHYRGFAVTQWRLYGNTGELKPLLYTFRALLTGIHLMRTGEVLAHLPTLLDRTDTPAYLPDLIAAKAEAEHGTATTGPDEETLTRDVTELHRVLDEARTRSRLPDAVTVLQDLHDLVVRARLAAPHTR
ncbi:nucleotidyltransferase domain-containing protein [Streptomyces sp. TRM75563]|uniref:nucleotidyltransferase domain-containing protein n=1 Tax=Streptomyces sp. TRM75563 TaxID=2817418 RepID=UPI001F60BBE7|nr:nucleotidyltransferase domain-containing protein [Streptomyces sp. TRM75563]MCI4040074.1 nucleotidyltransferase domain-containing protein [Streptomyces sp. TRM75563]